MNQATSAQEANLDETDHQEVNYQEINLHEANIQDINLQSLTDQELELSFHQVVKTERKIIHTVILHIQEISRRKLYLAKGFGSLAEYLIKKEKYSSSAAQRRIEAAKLVTDVPSVAAKLESGEINLTQIGEMQKAVKQAEKIHQCKISPDVKAELIDHLVNRTSSQTQQLCAEAFDIPVVESQKITVQKDGSRRAEFTFTKEQYEKYEIVRDLLAHKNFQAKRTLNMNDILETLFDEVIAKQQVKDRKEKTNTESKAEAKTKCSTGTALRKSAKVVAELKATHIPEIETVQEGDSVIAENTSAKWNSLTPKRKKIILQADQYCQYTDYETGRVCGSAFNLHVDHIIPRRVGGTNDPQNLRVLCREHNLFRNTRAQEAVGTNLS